MTVVGEAFVAVRPESTGFASTLQNQLGSAISSLPGPVAAIGAVGLAVGATLFGVGEGFDNAFRKIRSNTGATEDQMTGLESSFKKVLASGPSSMDAVASALSLVSQRTQLTGGDLEALTQTQLRLARITKVDVGTSVDATTKALANYGITGIGPSTAALNELLAVSQQTGISVPSLAASITGKAGASFRALGVDIGSAASIMGTLDAAGVSTGPVIMSLSKAITQAQKDGKNANDVLADLFNTLQTGTPGTQAYQDAITTLGSRGFQSLRDAVQTGKLSLADFNGAVGDSSAGLIDRIAAENQSIGGTLQTIKNKVMVALSGAGEAVSGFALNIIKTIPPAMDAVGDVVSSFYSTLTTGFTENDAATPIERFALGVRAVFFDLRDAAVTVFDTIRRTWDAVVTAFNGQGLTETGFIGQIAVLGGRAGRIFDELKADWGALVAAFDAGDGDITSSGWAGWFEQAGGIARQVFDTVKQGWSDLVAGFQGGNVVGPFAAIGEAARTVVDFLRDHWKPILAGAAVALGLLVAPIPTIIAGLVLLYQRSETFRNIVREIVAFIGDHWKPILMGAGAALLFMVSPIAAVVAGLVLAYNHFDAFRGIVDAVAGFIMDDIVPALIGLGGQMENFASFFIERWEKIRGSVENIAKVLLLPIGIAVAAALFIWNHFGEQIMAVLQFAWDEVKSILDFAVRVLGDTFDFITSILTGKWGDAWNDVKDILGAAVDLLKATVGNLGSFVLDFFSSLPSNILSALGDLAGFLIPKAIELIGGLLTGLVNAWVDVNTWFLNLPATILGFVADAGSWLYQAGVDIVQGMINGMGSLLSSIGDELGEVGKQAVNAFIGLFNKGIDFLDSFNIHVHQTMPSVIPNIDIDWNGLGIPHIPTLHTGGIVPGKVGEEVFARLLAGEVVINPANFQIQTKKLTGDTPAAMLANAGVPATVNAAALNRGFDALGAKHTDTNALLRELIDTVKTTSTPPAQPPRGDDYGDKPDSAGMMAAGRSGQLARSR